MKRMLTALACLITCTTAGAASATTLSPSTTKEDQFDIFDRPTNAPLIRNGSQGELSAQARQLIKELALQSTFDRLQSEKDTDHSEPSLDYLRLQCAASRRIQKASLQIQETFANIDGDIAQNNMLLAYASTKQERAERLANVATFLTIGTFGALESAFGRQAEVSDVFGLVGAGSSIALPLLALKPMHFSNPRFNQPRTNMLASIFDDKKLGDGYEPVVWHYLNSVPPQSQANNTRREMLLNSWRAYRSFKQLKEDSSSKIFREIVEAPSKENRLTVDALKTRAQLLLDVRALVQALYRDLAELDNLID